MVKIQSCEDRSLKFHFSITFGLDHLSDGFPGGGSGKEPAHQYKRHKRCRFAF